MKNIFERNYTDVIICVAPSGRLTLCLVISTQDVVLGWDIQGFQPLLSFIKSGRKKS